MRGNNMDLKGLTPEMLRALANKLEQEEQNKQPKIVRELKEDIWVAYPIEQDIMLHIENHLDSDRVCTREQLDKLAQSLSDIVHDQMLNEEYLIPKGTRFVQHPTLYTWNVEDRLNFPSISNLSEHWANKYLINEKIENSS